MINKEMIKKDLSIRDKWVKYLLKVANKPFYMKKNFFTDSNEMEETTIGVAFEIPPDEELDYMACDDLYELYINIKSLRRSYGQQQCEIKRNKEKYSL